MTEIAFLNVIEKIKNKVITYENFFNDEDWNTYTEIFAKKLKDYEYYIFDGRFEDELYRYTLALSNQNLNEIILETLVKDFSVILKEIYTVTNVIVLPLNHLNIEYLGLEVLLDENIRVFSMVESQKDIKNDKTFISKYIEQELNDRLNAHHILVTKDPYFFNYPIMTIKIRHVDYRVIHESPKIVESVYGLMRLMDMFSSREPTDCGWGVKHRDRKQEAYTYTVYYNLHKTSNEEGLYGYSFRFKFSPILDINTKELIEHKDRFTVLLNQVIDFTFLSENSTDKKEYQIKKKWVNAILLFNTAYEFASIGKYDSALVLFIIIIESLMFQIDEYNTKKDLINKLCKYFSGNEVQSIDIKKTILDIYEYRRFFVHQGVGLERFTTYRSLHDREGIVKGQKPFIYSMGYPMPEKEFNNYINFIKLIQIMLTNPIEKLLIDNKVSVK